VFFSPKEEIGVKKSGAWRIPIKLEERGLTVKRESLFTHGNNMKVSARGFTNPWLPVQVRS
jgi:hypothetical protein